MVLDTRQTRYQNRTLDYISPSKQQQQCGCSLDDLLDSDEDSQADKRSMRSEIVDFGVHGLHSPILGTLFGEDNISPIPVAPTLQCERYAVANESLVGTSQAFKKSENQHASPPPALEEDHSLPSPQVVAQNSQQGCRLGELLDSDGSREGQHQSSPLTSSVEKEPSLSVPAIKKQLILLYQQHSPEKARKQTIDNLLSIFKDRELDLLRKVQLKYGCSDATSGTGMAAGTSSKWGSSTEPSFGELPLTKMTPQQLQQEKTKAFVLRMKQQQQQQLQQQQQQRHPLSALSQSPPGRAEANSGTKHKSKAPKQRKSSRTRTSTRTRRMSSSGEMVSPENKRLSPMQAKTEVLKIYNKYNKAKLKDVDKIMKMYDGREEQLLQQLREKYIISVSNSKQEQEQEQDCVVASLSGITFTDNNNENANCNNRNVASSLSKLQAVEGIEAEEEDDALAGLSPEELVDRRIALLQFVLNFYSHYNPQNISNVDQIVDLFLGKETELLEGLKTKYPCLDEPLNLDWQPPEGDEDTQKTQENGVVNDELAEAKVKHPRTKKMPESPAPALSGCQSVASSSSSSSSSSKPEPKPEPEEGQCECQDQGQTRDGTASFDSVSTKGASPSPACLPTPSIKDAEPPAAAIVANETGYTPTTEVKTARAWGLSGLFKPKSKQPKFFVSASGPPVRSASANAPGSCGHGHVPTRRGSTSSQTAVIAHL